MSISKSKKIPKWATAEELDEMFDRGDDLAEYIDFNKTKTYKPTQRITIDFPGHILQLLDLEADKIGVTRTSLIKMWVSEQLSKHREK